MKPFSIGEIYLSKNNQRTIDINPLPENYCSFDCVFCPLGRTKIKTDKSFEFKENEVFLDNLEGLLQRENIDIVFINPNGEALANNRIIDIFNLIKKYNIKLKIISNGYLFNTDEYKSILNNCDEVIGELAVTNESYFQKVQRPLKGYNLEDYISNMESFNKQYNGKFILDITILKNYSDSSEDVEKFKKIINRIKPNEILVQTTNEGKFQKAFGVDKEKLKEIKTQLTLLE